MSLRLALLAAFGYALVVVLIVLEVPLVLNLSKRVDAEIKAESASQAQLVATSASDRLRRTDELQRLADRASAALGGRVVILGRAGRIVVDSAGPALRGEGYRSRPEVRAALRGRNSQGRRHSVTLDEELLYTAVPILRRGRPVGAVRVTQSVDAVDAEVREDAILLIGAGAIALAFGLGVAWLLAGALTRPLERLARATRRAGSGDLSVRARVHGAREEREVARGFNEMTERLQSVLAAQRDFVANASHQLRTPLTAVRLRIEAAANRVSDAKTKADLRAAENEMERLAGLLANLLVLAREGEEPPEPAPVELGRAARAAAERWDAEAADRGHGIGLEDGGEVRVAAAQEDLGIVLDNLIENALKYSPAGGTVTIGWGVAGGRGVLEVCDEGPGLAPGEEERVRERFFRGDAGAKQSGTGLGLAIIEALADRWSGELVLANRERGGLRARVALPLADPSAGSGGLSSPDRDFADS